MVDEIVFLVVVEIVGMVEIIDEKVVFGKLGCKKLENMLDVL